MTATTCASLSFAPIPYYTDKQLTQIQGNNVHFNHDPMRVFFSILEEHVGILEVKFTPKFNRTGTLMGFQILFSLEEINHTHEHFSFGECDQVSVINERKTKRNTKVEEA